MSWIKRDHKSVSEWVTSAFHIVMNLGGGSAPYSCGILDKPNFSQLVFLTWALAIKEARMMKFMGHIFLTCVCD